MNRIRVIPILLYKNEGLYKSLKFKDYKYIGDPINAVKVFNDKEVDELIFLNIEASKTEVNYEIIYEIASECFMPVCYGGGIRKIEDIRKILHLGIEKVSINSQAVLNPPLVREAAEEFGSSTIVVSMDVKKNIFGKYEIFIENGQKNTKIDPVEYAVKMEDSGAGELLVNSIDRDGTMLGYDNNLLEKISKRTSLPVIACGGAGKLEHLKDGVKKGLVSAAAAGSMFVYHGKHKAVLINYPSQKDLKDLFEQ